MWLGQDKVQKKSCWDIEQVRKARRTEKKARANTWNVSFLTLKIQSPVVENYVQSTISQSTVSFRFAKYISNL